VVVLGLSLAFEGHDFTELLLKMTGFFPPTLLFVGLTTYNLFGMGVAFTGVDGRILPKRARVFLYFGTLLLVVACMLFLSNERIAETNQLSQDVQTLLNNLFALSALVLGIPYVVWMVWKRREMLIGPEKDFSSPPRWVWLERVPGPAWLALSLVLACACACVLVGILYWLV
jgi:MFS superfamily sulfate permease-like transporter